MNATLMKPETREIKEMPELQKKDCTNGKENVCIIEYDERSLGHAFISKVYCQGGIDISIRFVKQKTSSSGRIYDPGTAPAGIQRQVVKLAIDKEDKCDKSHLSGNVPIARR